MSERNSQINADRYRVDERGVIVANEHLETVMHERPNIPLALLRRLGAGAVIVMGGYGLLAVGNSLSSSRPVEKIVTNPTIPIGDLTDKVQGVYDFAHSAIEAVQMQKSLTGDK